MNDDREQIENSGAGTEADEQTEAVSTTESEAAPVKASEPTASDEQYFTGLEEQRQTAPEPAWNRYLLIILITVVLLASSITVLTVPINLTPERSTKEAYFSFHTLESENFLSQLESPPSDVANGLTWLTADSQWQFRPSELPSRLTPTAEIWPDGGRVAFGFYRDRDSIVPIVLLTHSSPNDLLQALRHQEGDLSSILDFISGTAQARSFSSEHLDNSYARVSPGLTYGLIEQHHLIITDSRDNFRSILNYTRSYLRP